MYLISRTTFQSRLERSERLTLLSPGFLKNYQMVKKRSELSTKAGQMNQKALIESVEEYFYDLESIRDEKYYPHDCIVFSLEIDHNVLHRV